MRDILRSKAPSRGLWIPELVLYGMRLMAFQLLGTVLDIEVDNSVCMYCDLTTHLVHVEQNIVRVPVVARCLFLPGDDHGRLGGLLVLLPGHVEPEQVLGVLRDPVHLAHEELYQLPGEAGLTRGPDHLYSQAESLGLVRGGGLLQQVSESLALLPRSVVKPPRLQVVLLSLEVDGNAVIVLRGGVLQYIEVRY